METLKEVVKATAYLFRTVKQTHEGENAYEDGHIRILCVGVDKDNPYIHVSSLPEEWAATATTQRREHSAGYFVERYVMIDGIRILDLIEMDGKVVA